MAEASKCCRLEGPLLSKPLEQIDQSKTTNQRNERKTVGKLIVSVAAIACCFAASAVAQDEIRIEGGPVARFVTLPPKPSAELLPPVTLPTWTGSFTYSGKKYTYYMVGAAPSTGKSTTVKVFLIPVKLLISGHTFNPTTAKEG